MLRLTAAAMLGKYWSIFLLAGLGIAALCDPRRAAYFRSPAPWVTILVGALTLAPHLAWIVASDFAPFTYAVESHAGTLADATASAFGYLLGVAGYIAAPVILMALAARPGVAALADTLWPAAPDRRLVLIAFTAPILLPTLAALALKAGIVSLWAMGAMTLLPVVLLSSPLVTLPRRAAVLLLALALAFPVAMTLAAPVIAIVIHREGVPNNAAHYRLVAAAIEKAWRAATDKPLRLVGSQTNLVNGVVFYLASQPSTLDIMGPQVTPWADEARVTREGIALVCAEADPFCMQMLNARAARVPAARRSVVEISRSYLGVADAPVRYVIVIVPPQP